MGGYGDCMNVDGLQVVRSLTHRLAGLFAHAPAVLATNLATVARALRALATVSFGPGYELGSVQIRVRVRSDMS